MSAAIPDPTGIDFAIRLLGCATSAGCDSTAVESKALLGGPARCDAAAAGGPRSGSETILFVAAGATGTVYAGFGLATKLGASTGSGNLFPDVEPVLAVIFGKVAMLGTFAAFGFSGNAGPPAIEPGTFKTEEFTGVGTAGNP
jgi:hypothetical protein